MNLDDFRCLREIFSLLRSIDSLHQQIKTEESRLTSIANKKNRALDEKIELTQKLHFHQSALDTIELRLKQRLSADVQNQLEIEGFEHLEQIQHLHHELTDKESFLKGILNTTVEIQNEIEETNIPKKAEINSNLLRIEQLKNQLPSEAIVKLDELLTKNLPLGPFTSNQGGKCQFCLRSLSKIEESEIDVKLLLKTCQSCTRIFLPYAVLH